MKLNELKNTVPRKPRKRVGRGDGSGHGKTAGRGEKGAKSRSGYSRRPYFEGGQIPLIRRVPKRGFNNPNHIEFNVINIEVLEENFSAGQLIDRGIAEVWSVWQRIAAENFGDGTVTKAFR